VFGRLSVEKGQFDAISAFSEILSDFPGAKLLIVGDGKQRDFLEMQVRERDLARNVIFTGFQEDVKPLMAACDIVLVPSLKEGFGLAAVEAMAMGIPVVASSVGGLPEIVQNEVTGVLIHPVVPEVFPGRAGTAFRSTLPEPLGRLLADPTLRQKMGEAGRARAAEMFDREKQFALLREKLAEAGSIGPLNHESTK